jgi:arylsulfatase A-like enzyme
VLVDQGPYYNPAFLTSNGRVQRTGYTTDIITDRAVDWLREYARGEKPFALCVWHKAPHRNWMPAPRHYDWLSNQTIPEPPTLLDDWSGRSPASATQTMSIRKDLTEHDLKVARQGELTEAQRVAWDQAFAPRIAEYQARWKADHDGPRSDAWTRWAFQQYAKDYLRCVRAVDESVGRLLDELDVLGLDENTIVIYTSDQGWFLGEHGWYDKRWMYEESFRTPFIVRWPGVTAAGSSSVALCQNVDLAPTLLDIGGQPASARMHGRSMLPILKSKGEAPSDWRDAVYYRYYEGGDAATHSVPVHDGVRTDRWKLICFPDLPGGETWELFDLLNDPDEMSNVADDPANTVVRAELAKRLESLRSSTSARE